MVVSLLHPLLYLNNDIVETSTLFEVIHDLGTLKLIFIREKSLFASVEDISMYL